mmetsp:Transcript_24018/g.56694  ORF Transcript_24018/g.56694 Transcript_24018/m.56694 type:complete len:540 (-) Transcript_24018:332-1951(-)
MSDIPEIPQIMSTSASEYHAYSQRSQEAAANLTSPTAVTEDAGKPRRSSFLEQDEGVLMDVLQELDRERHKRAELEARVRVLEQEVHMQRRKNSKSSKTSIKDYALIRTERDSYKEILDVLTHDRPAFSSSSRQKHPLPMYVVRLLEVMPWDSRAQQYATGLEEVYEWQIYSADKKWHKELRYFPTFFKTLPITVPTPGKTMSDETPKTQLYFGASVSPPKQCVLTDLDGSTILNIDKGYPLPHDGGGWTWVGPWKVEKNNDTDEQGWSYSNDTEAMSDSSTYNGDFRIPEKLTANIAKRRRKWSRPRTLIDYPDASRMTREYLKSIAERSRLDSTLEKLSGKLVDTKMMLTTLEAEKELTDARMKELEQDLRYKNEILGLGENEDASQLNNRGLPDKDARASDTSTKSSESTKKVEEIRSAVTNWVSNTVQKQLHQSSDGNSTEGNAAMGKLDDAYVSEAEVDQSTFLAVAFEKSMAAVEQAQQTKQQDPKQQLFESLRDKGTGFLEILKQKGEQLHVDKIKQGGVVGNGKILGNGMK